jgi:hypothetical protein
MSDFAYDGFLETSAEDAQEVNAASDTVQVVGRPRPGALPHTYDSVLRDVEHLEWVGDGTVRVSSDPLSFVISFPFDYCRSTDPQLQFRVARFTTPLLHPNCQRSGIICQGSGFRPGTRLRPLIQEVYTIACGRNCRTDHAFDPAAAEYYLAHLDQVRALRARPLWRRPVAVAALANGSVL